jgi:ankyrin repeat protein
MARCLWVFQRSTTTAPNRRYRKHPEIKYTRILSKFRLEDDPSGPGSLFEAARNNKVVSLKEYDVQHLISLRDAFGKNLLHHASGYGSVQVVEYLLDCGFDVDSTSDQQLQTPLMYAVRWARNKVVKILLEAHAKLELLDQKDATALVIASGFGHVSTVKLLLEYGCTDQDVSDALAVACRYGHTGCAGVLMDRLKDRVDLVGRGLNMACK